MRILQINASYGIGSTGNQTKILHENLKKLGHESFVVAGVTDRSVETDKNIFVPCKRLTKRLNGFKARISGNQNNLAVNSTKRILKLLKQIKPDVIQVGNIHANFVSLKMLLEYIAENDIALVVVLHDCWLFTGKCTNYIDENCYGWQKNCGNCPKLQKDIPSWLFDKTERMLKEKKRLFDKVKKLTVVGVSEKITEDARNSYVFGGRNCTCIPNVTDDTIFFAENRQKDDDVTVIAGVAYEWSEYKGINQFIELGKLCSEHYGDKVLIRLAGNFRNLDNKTVDDLNSSGVEMTGFLSQNELAGFYRSADVFVSFSKGESYGLGISEAVKCGLFVITYEGYAEKEILSKNNYCKIVENEKNVEDFWNILKKFIDGAFHIDTKSSAKFTFEPQGVEDWIEKILTVYKQF